jgi:hypothetical protein
MSYTLWARKQGLVTPVVEEKPTPKEYNWPPYKGRFNRDRCELLLEGDTHYDNFNYGFVWRRTPQGHNYWRDLADMAEEGGRVVLSLEDRAYIQHILDTGTEEWNS